MLLSERRHPMVCRLSQTHGICELKNCTKIWYHDAETWCESHSTVWGETKSNVQKHAHQGTCKREQERVKAADYEVEGAGENEAVESGSANDIAEKNSTAENIGGAPIIAVEAGTNDCSEETSDDSTIFEDWGVIGAAKLLADSTIDRTAVVASLGSGNYVCVREADVAQDSAGDASIDKDRGTTEESLDVNKTTHV
jgi:hypothetical protein